MYPTILIILFLIILYFFYTVLPTRKEKCKYKKSRGSSIKRVYLTFDDGPSEYTDELLDLLDKYDVKASFFCVLASLEKYPNIVTRMKREGHIIGMHSLKHQSALLMSPSKTRDDFRSSFRVLQNLGVKPQFYRPPWGQLNLATLKCVDDYDLTLVLWHVMAEDWEKDTTDKVIEEKLLSRVNSGDIICLHDGRGELGAPKRTIEALKRVIPILLERGFEFETIDKYFEK